MRSKKTTRPDCCSSKIRPQEGEVSLWGRRGSLWAGCSHQSCCYHLQDHKGRAFALGNTYFFLEAVLLSIHVCWGINFRFCLIGKSACKMELLQFAAFPIEDSFQWDCPNFTKKWAKEYLQHKVCFVHVLLAYVDLFLNISFPSLNL